MKNAGNKKVVYWVRKEVLSMEKEQGSLGFRDWKSLNFLAFFGKAGLEVTFSATSAGESTTLEAKYFFNKHIIEEKVIPEANTSGTNLVSGNQLTKSLNIYKLDQGEQSDSTPRH